MLKLQGGVANGKRAPKIPGGFHLSLRTDPDLLILRALLAIPVLSAMFLFSCGANTSPQQIAVKVQDRFEGAVHIRPCMPDAGASAASADENGFVSTAACPRKGDPFTVLIDRAGRSYRVSSENAQVHYTGDGFPVTIEVAVPPND